MFVIDAMGSIAKVIASATCHELFLGTTVCEVRQVSNGKSLRFLCFAGLDSMGLCQ